MNPFDKDYFENGVNVGKSLYSNYRWIPDLTLPMAFRMIETLRIESNSKILDYGCAKGFLVKAMRLLYRDCYGVDISEYAIENSDNDISRCLQLIDKPSDLLFLPFNINSFDFVIAKDVFEHISPEVLEETVFNLRQICKCLFVIVPLGDGKKYYESSYEFDKTHIIREDVDWWRNVFLRNGFLKVDFFYKIPGIKDNWKCENGNGFFVLR